MKFLLNIFIFAIVTLISTSSIHAEEIIYSNNFESEVEGSTPTGWITMRNHIWNPPYTPCMNDSAPAVWTVKSIYGSKRVGIRISGDPCVYEIVPENFKIPDLSNYRYEVDMSFPGFIKTDRNIAFRYNNGSQWYGIKFINPNYFELQKVNFMYFPDLGTGYYAKGIFADNTYHITVETRNDLISFYIDDELIRQVEDQDPKVLQGTFALQASKGTLPTGTTYFDNIVITDLSEPKPKILDLPFYSQRDPQWGSEMYDHANKWAPKNKRGIKDWGCALTSAVMALRSHGFTKGPDGQDTNPSTLNQYLKDNKGFNHFGGVIWSAFTKYAEKAKASGLLSSDLPSLEFAYKSYVFDEIKNNIDKNIPSILKLQTKGQSTEDTADDGYHFIVSTGYHPSTNELYLHDPWPIDHEDSEFSDHYSVNQIRKVGTFTPSNTDLSYIWIYAKPTVKINMTKSNNDTTPIECEHDGAIYNTDSISPAFTSCSYAKPESDTYTITASNLNKHDSLELVLVDKYANIKRFIKKSGESSAMHFSITFDKENISKGRVKRISHENEVLKVITEMVKNHQINGDLAALSRLWVIQSQKLLIPMKHGMPLDQLLNQMIETQLQQQKITTETADQLRSLLDLDY